MSKASASVDDSTNFSRTFKYLLATQFLSRGIPFIFNSWIVRHLTAEAYALYAVQFHLFVTCVLFLSREGFRRACLRADIKWYLSLFVYCGDQIKILTSGPMDGASREANAAKLVKVAWLTLPLGIVITVAACSLVFWWQGLSYSNPYAQAILINAGQPLLSSLGNHDVPHCVSGS
ncbi:hypothetical protein Patl1_19834 [Pistacia atlantica]|uniref:Uncharacterized protein n=1 Tax=Pistacia atlantica TaxID=434234 RepID=A0ACC1BHI5_9ROSI|nr:hypothetical protein Patl1_19834 [Pistacia atlantica]